MPRRLAGLVFLGCWFALTANLWGQQFFLPEINELTDKAEVVVIADGGAEADGKFQVLESFKGEVPVGKMLDLPELKPYERAPIFGELAPIYERLRPGIVQRFPRQVSSRRVILFMNRDGEKWKAPTNLSWQQSIMWIETGIVLHYRQLTNPGPVEVCPTNTTELEFRKHVAAALRKAEQGGNAPGSR